MAWFSQKNDRKWFKGKNIPLAYLKAKRSKPDTPEPDDLDWSYVFTNNQLEQISKTSSISICLKTQRLKYIAHFTRLTNDSLQKQILFSSDHKKYDRDRWVKFEKELNIYFKKWKIKKSSRPFLTNYTRKDTLRVQST